MNIAGEEFLTFKEALDRYPVGYQTLYLAVKRGKIDAYRPGREIVVAAKSLHEWFLASKIHPRPQVGRPRKRR